MYTKLTFFTEAKHRTDSEAWQQVINMWEWKKKTGVQDLRLFTTYGKTEIKTPGEVISPLLGLI